MVIYEITMIILKYFELNLKNQKILVYSGLLYLKIFPIGFISYK